MHFIILSADRLFSLSALFFCEKLTIFVAEEKNMYTELRDIMDAINGAVCEVFSVDKDKLYSYDKHHSVNKARLMAIFIAHNDFAVSSNDLSKEYGRTRREIFWICQKMRFILGAYEEDLTLYRDIKKKLGIV